MRLALLVALLLALPAQAQNFFVPARLTGDAAAHLARAEQVVELVRRPREIDAADGTRRVSDLRVALVVLDNGPSTDVSPRHDVHLAMYNVLEEYGTAWALEPVGAIWRYESVKRVEAGIYAITGVHAGPMDGTDCYFPRVRITVDARALSVDVRQARGLEEFSVMRLKTPMDRRVQVIGCSEP